MSLFDSHSHIGSPDLLDEADRLLERAREAGVGGVIAIGSGYGIGPNAGAVHLADRYGDVWATAGVHPHDAKEWDELSARAIEGWLAHARVVAVGECGLDYHYEHSPREAQRECLRAQIRLARNVELPLVIHVRSSPDSRDALDELIRIFDEEDASRCGGVIHCFTGDLPFARECMARGFDISFSGILTFKNAQELRDVAAALPLDRLLIETDSPLLAPVPHRGKRNEPGYLVYVADCLAELHATTREDIAARTDARTRAAFRLPAAP